jgi:hypothetical protein
LDVPHLEELAHRHLATLANLILKELRLGRRTSPSP